MQYQIQANRLRAVGVATALSMGMLAAPAAHGQDIDPEADKALKSMSTYLGGLSSFSVNGDTAVDVVLKDGQKLQVSGSLAIVVQRPQQLRVHRQGALADMEIIFDGELLTLYGKHVNVYTQTEVAGTIDDAILEYEMDTGLPAPGADLLFADPYSILSSDIESSAYIGTGYVDGVECHHLAFRKDKIDWQIWIRTGEQPLPMKYVITSKWHTGAPQYSLYLRDWDTEPQIADRAFDFVPPDGAERLDRMTFDETGRFITEEQG